jgi:dihydrofolate reductase
MDQADVVASLAVSLDGYIAQSDGNVDFLQKYPIEEFDFDRFTDTIGALIMGSTTYLQTLQWGWMWGDRPTTVLTSRTGLLVPDGADIRFSDSPTVGTIRSFSAETPKRLWVFGGGKVVTDGLKGGVIDTLDITVMPEALGTGIPLFTAPYSGSMRLTDTTAYPNGAVRLVYNTTPNQLAHNGT